MRGTDAEQMTVVDRMPNRYRLHIGEKNQCRTDIGCRYEKRTDAEQISAADRRKEHLTTDWVETQKTDPVVQNTDGVGREKNRPNV
jgi:hypothetical protein